MGSANREGTAAEGIINRIFSELRNLDKVTWNNYNRLQVVSRDLIEDANYIITQLNEYIAEIKKAEELTKTN